MHDILVVEDDELIRSLVAEWLTRAGYTVCQAVDGEAALAAFRQSVSLVITDMSMPRRDGTQTLEWLRREHPSTPVIAMSGHFGDGRKYTRTGALALGARRVLAKPFTQEQLLEAVQELVGASRCS